MTALSNLNEEIKRCQDCDLAKNRTKVVPGEGPENAALLFIGEAPGWHEDQQGRPFVGPAGQFLEELLSTITSKESRFLSPTLLSAAHQRIVIRYLEKFKHVKNGLTAKLN